MSYEYTTTLLDHFWPFSSYVLSFPYLRFVHKEPIRSPDTRVRVTSRPESFLVPTSGPPWGPFRLVARSTSVHTETPPRTTSKRKLPEPKTLLNPSFQSRLLPLTPCPQPLNVSFLLHFTRTFHPLLSADGPLSLLDKHQTPVLKFQYGESCQDSKKRLV